MANITRVFGVTQNLCCSIKTLLVFCASQQTVRLPMIIWLLRNRFLYQVHSYVTLLPPADMTASTTIDSRTRSDVSMSDSSTDASSLSTCIFAASNDIVNLQSLSVSDVDTSADIGTTSDGRRTDADARDHTMSSKYCYHLSQFFLGLLMIKNILIVNLAEINDYLIVNSD